MNEFLDLGVLERLFGTEFKLENWDGDGALTLRRKDLRNVIDEADRCSAAVPLANLALEAHKVGDDRNDADALWSHDRMVLYWRVFNDDGPRIG